MTKDQLVHRKIDSWEYGYWWIEWGGNRDIIGDNERIRFELLSIVMGIWDYIKNSGDFPDSRYWAMDWVGMMPGKRGSRRLLGRPFPDAERSRCRAASPTPLRSAGGRWTTIRRAASTGPICRRTRCCVRQRFTISRCDRLYSRNISNLMMAGRNISATHAAFTSTRVMATCAVIGQAVGTAAAQCAERGIRPRQLASDARLVTQLQQILLRSDQTIKNARNEDPSDLARQAKSHCFR